MLLYIVRHGLAGERDPEQYPDDSLRPLTDEGRKRFSATVKRLVDAAVLSPSLIATSPLVRCAQTAEILAERIRTKPKVVQLDALQPSSDLDALLDWSAEQEVAELAWVGHAPDVSDLAATLVGDGNSSIRFAKGAIAAIRFEGPPRRAGGELQWLATAKLLGC